MAECRLGSSAGYSCYNCIYSTKPDHCPIITDEGLDVKGKGLGQITSHGICAIHELNINAIVKTSKFIYHPHFLF